MKKIIFIFFSIIVISSCSKDEATEMNNNNTSSNSLKLKKVLKNGEIWSQYEYNDQGKIANAFLYIDNAEFWRKRKYNYINDTIIIDFYDANNSLVNREKNYWINDLQIRVDDYEGDDQSIGYTLYTYNSNSCRYISTEFFNKDGTLSYKRIYNYIDSNCSWKSTDYNPINIANYKEVKIDNYHNAYDATGIKNFKLNGFGILGNFLSRVYKDNNGIVREDLSYNIKYVYNKYNYPSSSTRTYLDGTVDKFTYEYY